VVALDGSTNAHPTMSANSSTFHVGGARCDADNINEVVAAAISRWIEQILKLYAALDPGDPAGSGVSKRRPSFTHEAFTRSPSLHN
jgi:hypothetical protein